MSELLPCPFCGGEAGLHPTYDMDTNEVDGWFVWCGNDHCDCMPETNQHLTEAEAIAAWNSRAERTCNVESTLRWDSYHGEEFYEHKLSCGHVVTTDYSEPPYYCGECGAKVMGE